MATKVEAVILDYGEVLSLPQSTPGKQELFKLSGLEDGEFFEIYWKHRAEYDRGLVNGDGYWNKTLKAAGTRPSPSQIQRLIQTDVLSWSELNPVMLKWVLQLKAGSFRTALISNMGPELYRAIKDDGKLESFEEVVISCQVGITKPDPQIYQTCLHGLDLPARRTLFLDDRLENVEAARALGMNALLFESAESCADELAENFDLPRPV